jgi:hypothetical protein
MSTGPTIEVSDGEPGRPPYEPGRIALLLAALDRRHRRAVTVTGIAVGALVVGAVGVGAVRLMPSEPLPTLDVLSHEQEPDAEPPWTLGDDGRPAGPPVMVSTVRVRRSAAAGPGAASVGVEARVLGIAGPGVVRNESPLAPVSAGGTPSRCRCVRCWTVRRFRMSSPWTPTGC